MNQSTIPSRPTRVWLIAFGLSHALLSACAATPDVANSESATARVRALVGAAPCVSDSECRSIGIGTKACGGPQAYLAWSIRGTDASALQHQVELLAQASQAEDARAGRVSTCSIVPDPGALCSPAKPDAPAGSAAAGHCQLCHLTHGRDNGAR